MRAMIGKATCRECALFALELLNKRAALDIFMCAARAPQAANPPSQRSSSTTM